MTLEDNIKRQIERDLLRCNREIERVLKEGNSLIADPDYLDPTCRIESVCLDSSAGEFQYFSEIKRHLNSCLASGFFEEGFSYFNPPKLYNSYILRQRDK